MLNIVKTGHRMIFSLAITACCVTMITSCSDDIVIDNVDESRYEVDDTYGYLRNADIPRSTIGVELNGATYGQPVIFGLTKGLSSAQTVTIEANTSLVAAYNKANFTEYEAFPASQVTVPGAITVDKWRTESSQFNITFSKGSLANGEYLLPVSIKSIGGDVKVTDQGKVLYYIVKVGNPVPDNRKPYKILCYVEVNDGNILNVGSYTLKNSGKQFFDIAIIFAANINYNYDTKRAYLKLNDNVQHVLKNRDKYIKPLQDKGIKVTLSILGNHDFTGLSNMGGQNAVDFAAECKSIVQAYGLDGIDLDDEYSSYQIDNPQYGPPTPQNIAELVLALRDAMPDKILTVYNMGYAASMPSFVNGRSVANAIDHMMFAYYGNYNVNGTPVNNTLPKSKYAPVPARISMQTPSVSRLLEYTQNYVVNLGHGTSMFYDLRDTDASSYLSNASLPMFGEEVVLSGPSLPKDY